MTLINQLKQTRSDEFSTINNGNSNLHVFTIHDTLNETETYSFSALISTSYFTKDEFNNFYVADSDVNVIRRITIDGSVQTVAGCYVANKTDGIGKL